MSASDDTDNNTNNDMADNNRFLMIYSSLKHITTPR